MTTLYRLVAFALFGAISILAILPLATFYTEMAPRLFVFAVTLFFVGAAIYRAADWRYAWARGATLTVIFYAAMPMTQIGL